MKQNLLYHIFNYSKNSMNLMNSLKLIADGEGRTHLRGKITEEVR
jgi:hypothetical protein